MNNQAIKTQTSSNVPHLARLAVAITFFIAGSVFGNWVSRIPTVQAQLGMSNATLGLALLGLPIGLLIAAPTTGWLTSRFGSRIVTRVAGVSYCLSLILPGLAPDPGWLFAALLVFGTGSGTLDVAMNTQASAVEKRYGRSIMSSFHGLWSVGGLAGSAVGGAVAAAGVAPRPQFIVAGCLLAIIAFLATMALLPRSDASHASSTESVPAFARPSRSLAFLGLIAFCVFLGEGAVSDWSGVYLHTVIGAPQGLSAAGFAAFSLAMAGGRLSGDWVNHRIGPVMLLRLGGIVGAMGLTAALLIHQPYVVICGFVLVGIGIAAIFPVALSAASRDPKVQPGTAIAAVTTLGYFAFLVGPPLIGLASEALTLPGALGLVVALIALVAVLAPSARHGAH